MQTTSKNFTLHENVIFLHPMRNNILFLIACVGLLRFSADSLKAQVPAGIPYQAVARNATGNLIVSQPVGIRFSILSDTPSPGTIWFEERHTPTTTDLGQINLTIGTGTLLSGNFSTIPWEHSNVRLQVDMDPSGGTSYSVSGITVFGTVPYAFRSGASSLSGNGVPNGTSVGQTLRWNGTAWVAASNMINNGTNISINPGTSAPDLALTLGDNISQDGGIVAKGKYGTGGSTLNTIGDGVRLIWYPKKAAFRAGNAIGNTWDDSQIGIASWAGGYSTIASGLNSFSFGYGTSASGTFSVSMGSSNEVSGEASAAFGAGNQVAGYWSFAAGKQNVVSNSWATAFGSTNTASAYYSLVSGQYNTASGEAAVAFGYLVQARGRYSFAGGYESVASGARSMAFGHGALARSWSEIALGSFNTDYTPVDSNSFNSNDRIFVIGNGNFSARKNALVVLKNGNLGIGENIPSENFVVGSGGKFRIDSLGNVKRINNVAYSWPSVQSGINQFLKNDGSGNLTWSDMFVADNSINSAKLIDGSISTIDIANNAITTALINDGAVTSAKILDGTIAGNDMALGSISSSTIADGTINNLDINSSAAISLTKLATLTTNRVLLSDAGGLITAASTTSIELGYLSGVTSSIQSQLNSKANSSVLTNYLPLSGGTMTGDITINNTKGLVYNGTTGNVAIRAPASAITSYTLTLPTAVGSAGQVLSTDATGTLSWISPGGGGTVTNVATGSGLTGGPITGSGTISVAAGGIATAMIADNAVTSVKIADGTIAGGDIANDAITTSLISDGAVTSAKLSDGTIASIDLADNSVNGSKLAMGSDALGDMLVYNGTDYVRLAAGTEGQILKMSGGSPTWSSPSGIVNSVGTAVSAAVTPTATLAFVSPTVSVSISNISQRVLVDVTCAFGAGSAAATALNIYPAHKLTTGSTITTVSGGIWGLTCPANTRQTYAITGVITGLTAGTYQVGMAGTGTNWTSNEFCYVRAVLVN